MRIRNVSSVCRSRALDDDILDACIVERGLDLERGGRLRKPHLPQRATGEVDAQLQTRENQRYEPGTITISEMVNQSFRLLASRVIAAETPCA